MQSNAKHHIITIMGQPLLLLLRLLIRICRSTNDWTSQWRHSDRAPRWSHSKHKLSSARASTTTIITLNKEWHSECTRATVFHRILKCSLRTVRFVTHSHTNFSGKQSVNEHWNTEHGAMRYVYLPSSRNIKSAGHVLKCQPSLSAKPMWRLRVVESLGNRNAMTHNLRSISSENEIISFQSTEEVEERKKIASKM